MPDGTEMELRDAIYGGQPALSECNTYSPGTGNASRGRLFISRDGSLTFVSDTNIYDDIFAFSGVIERYTSGYLLQKDGTRHRIKDGRVEWIRDRNGNLLTFTYEETGYTRLAAIKDALNRQITITYSHWDPALSDISISYKGFGGAPRTISIQRALLQDALIANETTATFQALFPGTLGSSTEQFNARVVKTVTLPDNRTYELRYNKYGELSRVELPTGGVFTYQWASGNPQDPSGWEGKFINRRVIKKSIYKDATSRVGSTSFGLFEADPSETFGSAKIRQLDEFDAPLTDERHYFHGLPMDQFNHEFGYSAPPIIGREFKTERNTANGATVLQRIEHTYDSASINISQTLTTLADISPNLISKQTFAYDGFFNLTDTYEYDFGQGTPGSFLRRIHTDYVNTSVYTGTDPLAVHAGTAAHLRNLPSQSWISSDTAGNSKKSLMVYEYDNYADDVLHDPLTPRSNISGLCTTFDAAGTCNNANPTGYVTRGNVTTLTSYTNASVQTGGVTVASQYDIAGNIVQTIDARGHATQYDFNDCYGSPDANAQNCAGAAELGAQVSYALPRSVTNALGHVIHKQYDYYLGALVNIEDTNGIVSSQEYGGQGLDLLDRPSRSIQAINTLIKSQRQTVYNDLSHTITSTSDLNQYDDNLRKQETLYDGLGRTLEKRNYETSTDFITTKVEFDAFGRVKRSYNPYRTTSDETYGWREPIYDALSRVIRVQRFDRLGASAGVIQTDYSGNMVLVTDQAGKKRLSQAGALGLTEIWEISAPDSGTTSVSFAGQTLTGYLTQYEYDALGDLTKVKQGNQPHRVFSYNSLGQLTDATNPESGHVSYDYDLSGNLFHKTDARNIVTTFEYDELNRIETRTYSDGTPAVTYTYDTASLGVGRLANVSSSISNYSYTQYNELGRVKNAVQSTDGVSYPMSYEFNLAGALTSQTYSSGRVLKIEYDTAGRIAGMKNEATGLYYAGASSTDQANRLQYSSTNRLQAMKLGNGLWEHTNFNSRSQPVQIGLGTSTADSSRLRVDYAYGVLVNGVLDVTKNNGNVQSQTITLPELTLNQSYSYDELNRLESAQETNGATPVWKQTYSYDPFGNRMFDADTGNTTLPQITPQNQASTNPAISQINNRISTAGYRYDLAGNLECDPNHPCGSGELYPPYYEYDAENRIKTAAGGSTSGGSNYAYDGDGRRVKKIVGGAQIRKVVFVYNVAGQLVAEYSDTQPSVGGTSYLTADSLGTPRVITNANGSVIGRHDYQPFGEEVPASYGGRSDVVGYPASDTVRQQFTSKERDTETGLDHFGARSYSYTLGRFASVDPVMKSASIGDPQSFNRYTYVLNSPLVLDDPDGRCPKGKKCYYEKGFEFYDDKDGNPVAVTETLAKSLALTPILATIGTATDYEIVYRSFKVIRVAPRVVPPVRTGGVGFFGKLLGAFGIILTSPVSTGCGAAHLPMVSDGNGGCEPVMSADEEPDKSANPDPDDNKPDTSENKTDEKAEDKKDPEGDVKKLSRQEVRKLQKSGIDIHELKGGKGASRFDLYKDSNGDIWIKRKGGGGEADPTGFNIKDFP
jgi:RHS repeat-associated protein